MINPFIIGSDAEQSASRAYADRDEWCAACRSLGATDEQLHVYDVTAWQYAAATPYPNSVVVAYVRRLAYEALLRGDPMPADIEQVIQDENARELARLLI